MVKTNKPDSVQQLGKKISNTATWGFWLGGGEEKCCLQEEKGGKTEEVTFSLGGGKAGSVSAQIHKKGRTHRIHRGNAGREGLAIACKGEGRTWKISLRSRGITNARKRGVGTSNGHRATGYQDSSFEGEV